MTRSATATPGALQDLPLLTLTQPAGTRFPDERERLADRDCRHQRVHGDFGTRRVGQRLGGRWSRGARLDDPAPSHTS